MYQFAFFKFGATGTVEETGQRLDWIRPAGAHMLLWRQ